MSVYRPKNSPYFQYDFRSGGIRFHGSTGETTRRAAEQVEKAEKKKASSIRKSQGKVASVTLNQAAGEYWDNVARHQSSSKTTEYQIENLIRLMGADTYLETIGDPEIAEFVAKRRGEESSRSSQRRNKERKKRREDKKTEISPPEYVSPASVNRETELLKRIIRRSVKTLRARMPEEADRPDWSIHKLTEADPPDRPLSVDQESRLYNELVPHARAPVDVALLAGIRKTEILTLDCANLDFSAMQGRVRRKSKKPGGEWFTFPITEPLLVILALYVDGRAKGPVFRFGPPCDCPICRKPENHGRPIKSIRSTFEGARRRAENDEFRFHDLRHTVGARVMRETGDLKGTQEFLGHKDISTTMRYVRHAQNGKDDIQRALANARGIQNRDGESRTIPEVVDHDSEKRRNFN